MVMCFDIMVPEQYINFTRIIYCSSISHAYIVCVLIIPYLDGFNYHVMISSMSATTPTSLSGDQPQCFSQLSNQMTSSAHLVTKILFWLFSLRFCCSNYKYGWMAGVLSFESLIFYALEGSCECVVVPCILMAFASSEFWHLSID